METIIQWFLYHIEIFHPGESRESYKTQNLKEVLQGSEIWNLQTQEIVGEKRLA